MKIQYLALVSAAALSLAACMKKEDTSVAADNASSATTITNDMPVTTPVAAPASAGQTFANTAAASDAFEIESSRLAAANASSAAVKKFATQMIAGHTDSTAKLKATTAALTPAITPDPTLSAAQQQTIDDLKGKTGTAFDSAYAAAQSVAHQQTLDALKGYAATGDVPALKTFASGLVPTVAAHLNMAKALK